MFLAVKVYSNNMCAVWKFRLLNCTYTSIDIAQMKKIVDNIGAHKQGSDVQRHFWSYLLAGNTTEGSHSTRCFPRYTISPELVGMAVGVKVTEAKTGAADGTVDTFEVSMAFLVTRL